MSHPSADSPPLPLRTLPVVEHWDCHGCGQCCHGGTIPLDEDDLDRIRRQGWEQCDEFCGQPVLQRHGFWKKSYRLARRHDGSCIFLTGELRCRIHEEFGEAGKPRVCRDYPFLIVPLGDVACLSTRRSCPSAAAEQGRPVDCQRDDVRRFAERHPARARPAPAIIPGHRRSWNETHQVLETLERLVLDDRYPLVRRLVHGLYCCNLLRASRLGELDGRRFGSLLEMLEGAAAEESAGWFRQRSAPGRLAELVFRRVAVEYLFLHPRLLVTGSWRQRVRLARVMLAVSRGIGRVPPLDAEFPGADFARLNGPLGRPAEGVLWPLVRYFETSAVSKQYAILGRRRWSIVESFQALALTYPVALWLLRFRCPEHPPEVNEVIDAVGAVERGQGHEPLFSSAHRRRLRTLAQFDELPRLTAWYAR